MTKPDDEVAALRQLIRPGGYDGSVSARAQIVLWFRQGHRKVDIAAMAGTTRPTVDKWLSRYERQGVAGLESEPAGGPPPSVAGEVRARILAVTRTTPPADTGLEQWSSRGLARHLKRAEGITVGHDLIARLWRETDLQPWRRKTFKLSSDPDFNAKVTDIVGLYLNPPPGAVVLSVDEKTQVQALERSQLALPLDFGKTATRTADYWRHGTTNLFAALNVHTGQVTGQCYQRRRRPEFLKFLDHATAQYPGRDIHIVLDNLNTHKGDKVRKWLARHPNVTLHYTPTGSSWINQVETFFGIITKQAIRNGSFRSTRQLIKRINQFIANWNLDAKPFEWTATAAEIIAKVDLIHRQYKKLLANNAK